MLDLNTLNDKQREAVLSTQGPLLVLAGAGSGKTKVLTYRIAYILDQNLSKPVNILAMTFTNKAANEMKERINKLLSFQSSHYEIPWLGTFHSICVKILRLYGSNIGLNTRFSIVDSSDQKDIVKEAMIKLNISVKEFNPYSILSFISSAKNQFINQNQYKKLAQGYFQNIVSKVYEVYQEILSINNALDFDDLLMKTLELLNQDINVLNKLQDNFKYVFIDEYQDTNHIQYLLMKLISEKHKNVCVVGDDDQSIYSFRGADVNNILNFEKDYPSARVIKLDQNYRSTKKILDSAYCVISKNTNRKDKKLWTQNSDGDNITIYSAVDELDESNWVCNNIKNLISTNKQESISILFRTNYLSRVIEETLLRHGIPYKILGSVGFYDRKEIKDIVAYLRCLFNHKDNKSFVRIANVPRRGIGQKSIEFLEKCASDNSSSMLQFILDNDIENLNNLKVFASLKFLFTSVISNINQSKPSEVINQILNISKYLTYLSDGKQNTESRLENIGELISLASKYDQYTGFEGIGMLLEEISLMENVNNNSKKKEDPEDEEFVHVMTIHSAKGLEFDNVFIIGMEEGIFPHSSSSLFEGDLEEERRLAYVALTRAKKKLYLTFTKKRKVFGINKVNTPSRFIYDIDKSLLKFEESVYKDVDSYYSETDYLVDNGNKRIIDFKKRLINKFNVGDCVLHKYFGRGKVISIDSDVILVDFGGKYGKKEMLLEYADLRNLNNEI